MIAGGKGSVNFITNRNITFQINNLIYSKNFSENFLSLRHFAEARYSIHLDYEVDYIFNRKTKKIFASGI